MPPLLEGTKDVLNKGCLALLGDTLIAGLKIVLGGSALIGATATDVAAGEGELVAVGGVSPTVHAFNKKLAVTITPGQ
ncbi:MAG: hypothetical protein HC935_02755 [Pseudanabaena sp. SU_2_4]|nr:hypothetical protein [Pseudanabaena sp. SU_2_4]